MGGDGKRVALPKCGAKKRQSEGTCTRPSGWGTDHVGSGRCKLHGGATRNGKKNAARIEAQHLAVELDMEPHDALLWCIRTTAGEVSFMTRKINELDEARLIVEHERERQVWGDGDSFVERSNAATLHVWVSERQAAIDRLARFSKMALDAGVAERQVRLAERLGEQLAALIDGILSELNLTPAQRKLAPAAVRKHLVVLEGGRAA